MWVFTTNGFYMPGLRPPGTIERGDDRTLQIRCRRKKDLTYLRDYYLPELGKTIRLPGTDYEYRAYCTPAQWGEALYRLAMDIDYVKFEEQTEDRHGDKPLHDAYIEIWRVLWSRFSRPRRRR